MAHIPSLRVDDVIRATKGQQVIATRKHKVVIPAVASASGKREVHDLTQAGKATLPVDPPVAEEAPAPPAPAATLPTQAPQPKQKQGKTPSSEDWTG